MTALLIFFVAESDSYLQSEASFLQKVSLYSTLLDRSFQSESSFLQSRNPYFVEHSKCPIREFQCHVNWGLAPCVVWREKERIFLVAGWSPLRHTNCVSFSLSPAFSNLTIYPRRSVVVTQLVAEVSGHGAGVGARPLFLVINKQGGNRLFPC
jgi:hypothetical protein